MRGDDKMVEDAHIDQGERVLQCAGEQFVRGARLGCAGGVEFA